MAIPFLIDYRLQAILAPTLLVSVLIQAFPFTAQWLLAAIYMIALLLPMNLLHALTRLLLELQV